MKAVIQRVGGATLSVDGELISQIGKGLVVYFCVEKGDSENCAVLLPTNLLSCVFSRTATAR